MLKSYYDKGYIDTTYIDKILPIVAYNYSIGLPIALKSGDRLVGPWVTGSIFGIKGALSGTIEIDSYHDRTNMTYLVYSIYMSNGNCEWKLSAIVNTRTGTITWITG